MSGSATQQEQPKDLTYFLNNPEQMPEDLAAIAALSDELDTGSSQPEQDVKSAASGAAAGGEVAKKNGEEAADGGDKTGQDANDKLPIQNKSGTGTIPYGVLQGEREKRQDAERRLQELTERLAQVEKQAKGEGGEQQKAGNAEAGQQDLAEIVSPEDLEALKADFPTVGAVLESLISKIKAAEQVVNSVKTQQQSEEDARAKTVGEQVREAIDGNATLSYWESKDPEKFALAVEQDKLFLRSQSYQKLPLSERYAKVVKAIEEIHGATTLPADFQPLDDQQTLAAKAEKAIKDAGSFKPRTLSDLPGGMPPAAGEMDNIANLTPEQLQIRMMDMSVGQIEALLAKAG